VTETAVCPAKTRPVGGGFLGGGFLGNAIVFESRMVRGKAWRVSEQYRAAQNTALVAYAHCRKQAPKTLAVSRTSASATAGAGPTATASCSGKRKAVAGGLMASPPIQPSLEVGSVVTDSARSGAGRWRTRVLSGDAGASVTGFAYCAKQKKAPTALKDLGPTVTGDLTSTGVFSPRCKCGKTVVMGGFSQQGATALGLAYPAYTVSKRSGRQRWNVRATDIGGGALAVSSTAYCG